MKGSGNDVFFRNPASAEENLFVGISSPSSTKFDSPRDLGSPEDAARKVLEQTLTEFMSTRIGVRRESSVVSATERVGVGVDGEPMVFYDCVFRVASYATKNQYGLTEADRPQVLEWDRMLSSTLGVANKRLYELRTQCAAGDFERAPTRDGWCGNPSSRSRWTRAICRSRCFRSLRAISPRVTRPSLSTLIRVA